MNISIQYIHIQVFSILSPRTRAFKLASKVCEREYIFFILLHFLYAAFFMNRLFSWGQKLRFFNSGFKAEYLGA